MEATIKIIIGNTFIKLIFFLAVIFVISPSSYSQNTIIYNDKFKSTDLDSIIEYYEDTSGQLNIEDILSSDAIKFKYLGKYKNLGFTRSSFWVRFRVQNRSKIEKSSVLILRAKIFF